MRPKLLACAGRQGFSSARRGNASGMALHHRPMTRRVRNLIAPVAAVAALALLPGLAVASPGAVVRDCAEDGSLDGNYSDADKRAALGQIPADLDEYSDCRAVISGAIGGPKAGASGRDSGGGDVEVAAAAKQKAKKKAAARARARRGKEAALGARTIDPRSAGVLNASDTENGLPLPLLLALIALGLLALAGATLALGKRSDSVASVLRRVPIPGLRR